MSVCSLLLTASMFGIKQRCCVEKEVTACGGV